MKPKLSAIDYLRNLFIEEFKKLPQPRQDVIVKLVGNHINTLEQFLKELKTDDDLVGWLLYEVEVDYSKLVSVFGLELVFQSKEIDVFEHGKTYIQVTCQGGGDFVYDFVKPKTIKVPTTIYVKI